MKLCIILLSLFMLSCGKDQQINDGTITGKEEAFTIPNKDNIILNSDSNEDIISVCFKTKSGVTYCEDDCISNVYENNRRWDVYITYYTENNSEGFYLFESHHSKIRSRYKYYDCEYARDGYGAFCDDFDIDSPTDIGYYEFDLVKNRLYKYKSATDKEPKEVINIINNYSSFRLKGTHTEFVLRLGCKKVEDMGENTIKNIKI